MQQREVNADMGLNFNYMVKVSCRMSNMMQILGDLLAEKITVEATHKGA